MSDPISGPGVKLWVDLPAGAKPTGYVRPFLRLYPIRIGTRVELAIVDHLGAQTQLSSGGLAAPDLAEQLNQILFQLELLNDKLALIGVNPIASKGVR